jgi:predicted NUDIX family NTP pyrophosphohydrolase
MMNCGLRSPTFNTQHLAFNIAIMRPISAGCLVTRDGANGIEVLLVHPRGASFRRPLFGIPKGLIEAGEDEQTAARRETYEETGLRVRIRADLGTIQQKSGKIVHAFWATLEPGAEQAIDAQGRCRAIDDENDVCRFYPLEQARTMMIEAQRELLDRLPPIES